MIPATALSLAQSLPGWEIQTSVLQPEGCLLDRVLYRLSARDERNTQAILTIHGDWCASPSDSAPSLLRGLLLHGGLSEDEATGVRALLPGGRL